LAWWENVPVASWILLRARCHGCGQPISARYPLVELSTGIAFALVTWGWHGSAVAAGYCCLAAAMIAVALIEYGGQRAPLAVAAIGTGVGLAIIVLAAGWQHHWRTLNGAITGTAIALLTYAVLRLGDPECTDARGHGRSALLMTGCWIGGLGLRPAIIGAVAWIVGFFICMTGAWWMTRPLRAGLKARPPHPVVASPLVAALAGAMVASLIAGG
jgi:leader peptidase (prepilin peptidase)/N-methyltransferase